MVPGAPENQISTINEINQVNQRGSSTFAGVCVGNVCEAVLSRGGVSGACRGEGRESKALVRRSGQARAHMPAMLCISSGAIPPPQHVDD